MLPFLIILSLEQQQHTLELVPTLIFLGLGGILVFVCLFSEEKASSIIYPNYCWAFTLFTLFACLPIDVFSVCVAHLLPHPQPRVAQVIF